MVTRVSLATRSLHRAATHKGPQALVPARRRLESLRMMASEGQIQSELMESMRKKIETALNATDVQVSDVQGDGRHVEIMVVSSEFEGKSSVNRQRMVYKAIWEELQDTVHAVDAMVTKAPSEL